MEHTESLRRGAPIVVLVVALVLVAACGDRTTADPIDADEGLESSTGEPTTEPVETSPLVGTVWLLDTVYGPGEGSERSESVVDPAAAAVELVFGASTATVRSAPCTDAVYEVRFTGAESGGSLEVVGGGGVECRGSEGDNANHDVATGGLVGASSYLIGEGRLVLAGEEGELIGFTAQPSAGG